MTEEVLVRVSVPAAMRDGTTLMSNVYSPAAAGEHPVLQARLPYGKDLPLNTEYLDPVKVARRGYIVVIQDVRGRFASEGEFTPFVREFEDGYDSVEWAARLPGSNGSVGMVGLSYLGKAQWQAAVTGPPSIASLVPGQTWGNHLNGAQMRGGAYELGLMQYWSQTALAPGILLRHYRDDPVLRGEKLATFVPLMDELLAGGGYDALPHPDGRSIVVTDGIVRASARESYPAPGEISPKEPSEIEPGRPYEYCVDLWATGITFRAGHRLRVQVTSSSFPRWDRNPNTGPAAAGHATRTEVARQRVFHDPERPSHLTLTVAES